MSQEAAANTAQKPRQRLSSAQMLHLMRLETDQALRHHYPISCMVIGLDGFGQVAEKSQRKALMPQVFRSLKEVCFESDVRGLGLFTENYHLAVFPHVEPAKLNDLAQAMLEKARLLEVPVQAPGAEARDTEPEDDAPTVIHLEEDEDEYSPDPRDAELPSDVATESPTESDDEAAQKSATVTLSIGISHNLHPGQVTFETLVEDAETGMELSRGAGGDRFIQARDVETELDRLREEIQQQISELADTTEDLIENKDSEEETWARSLVLKTIQIFDQEPDQSEGVLRLKGEVVAHLQHELKTWRETSTVSQMLEKQRQIQNLERRVTKLTQSLDMTEAELQRVATLKSIDTGVSSIYRDVQGLSQGDDSFEQKSAMLTDIFEANLTLQGKAAPKK